MAIRKMQLLCALIVLSGCGHAKRALELPKEQAKPAAMRPVQQAEEVLRLNERQMVLLFKALLLIDRKEGIGFTREQAEKLLPVIRKNSIRGELTQSDRSHILQMLTSAQQRYYEELQKRAERPETNTASRRPLDQQDRERLIEEFERNRARETAREGEPSNEKVRSKDSAEGNPAPNCGKNIEQQLLDLLESRLQT